MREWNRNPTKRELHRFGWTMLGGFLFLGAAAWFVAWRKSDGLAHWYAWVGGRFQWTSVFCGMLGVLLFAAAHGPERLARAVYVAWMHMATAIGSVMAVVWLTILYVAVLPFFTFIKLADPLRLRRKIVDTHWEPYAAHEATLARMRRPF